MSTSTNNSLPVLIEPRTLDEDPSHLPTDDPYALLLSVSSAGWDPLQEVAVLPKILLGSVPANLPFAIELPEETVLIGSITDQDEQWGQVYFTTTLASAVAIESFKANLVEQGLEELTGNDTDTSVFAINKNRTPPGFAICDQEKTFIIWGTSFPLRDGVSIIRFGLDRSGSGGICQMINDDPSSTSTTQLLPTLIAPSGVVPQEQGGSVGFNSVSSTSELESILSLLEITDNYNTQLAEADWQLLEQDNNGSAAWSLWTFHDAESKPWTASLYLFTNPVSATHYTAILRADRQK